MTTPTFLTLQQRYLDLIGDSDGTIDDFGKRNINAAIADILNKFSFSWDVASGTVTLSSGIGDLPNDYNPVWGLLDARIGDDVFTQIPIHERGNYSDGDSVYWITYNTSTDLYQINSTTQSGTLEIYYNFVPLDLSNTTDVCVVPDLEAVSYLAASKNWIGAERDNDLKQVYQQDADRYIQAMWLRDLQNGPIQSQGSVVEYNPDLIGG